jgi:hypothetical protein
VAEAVQFSKSGEVAILRIIEAAAGRHCPDSDDGANNSGSGPASGVASTHSAGGADGAATMSAVGRSELPPELSELEAYTGPETVTSPWEDDTLPAEARKALWQAERRRRAEAREQAQRHKELKALERASTTAVLAELRSVFRGKAPPPSASRGAAASASAAAADARVRAGAGGGSK